MTLPIQIPSNEYVADGVIDTFSFTFRILQNSDLVVTVDDILQTEGVEYTIAPGVTEAGGDIVFEVASIPANGLIVSLVRITPLDQNTIYTAFDPFPAKTHEGNLDKLTMIIQELEARITELEP